MGQMMDIQTERQITPEVAKQLRERSGLTQRKFWESVGSNQTSGHWFETGKRKGIPKALRILIFQRYVAKIELDFNTPQAAQAAIAVGREISAKLEAHQAEIAAKQAEAEAKEAQRRARELAKKAREVAAV